MVHRNRVKVRATSGSGYVDLTSYPGHWLTSSPITTDREDCDDYTSAVPHPDQPLVLTRRFCNPLIVNGVVPYGYAPAGRTLTCNNYSPLNRTGYQYCPSVSAISSAYYKTKALANMDPYRPAVDLPLFLFELRDLPHMVREMGDVLSGRIHPSSVPGGYLSYQFGWAPLVSDVSKMFDFAHQTWQRCRTLRQMEAGHRVRRHLERGTVINETTAYDGYSLLNAGPPGSNPWALKADIHQIETLDVWFTANAQLTVPLPNQNSDLRRLARRLVYGLTFRPATVWNAIPWTWLSDYFLNIGDYMEAQNGLTRFKCTRMNVMIKQQVDSSLVNVRLKSGISSTESLMRTVQKKRSVYVNPTPTLSGTPFLNGGQQAILGALATASALRGVRR